MRLSRTMNKSLSTLPFRQPCRSRIKFSCPGKILHAFCGKFGILHGITQLHKASIDCARIGFLVRIQIIRVKAGIKCLVFHTVIDNIFESNPTGVYLNLSRVVISNHFFPQILFNLVSAKLLCVYTAIYMIQFSNRIRFCNVNSMFNQKLNDIIMSSIDCSK